MIGLTIRVCMVVAVLGGNKFLLRGNGANCRYIPLNVAKNGIRIPLVV